jgi:protein gp37
MTMARRLKAMGSAKYQNDGDPRTSGPGFAVTMHQESVLEPILKWPRKSQVVFLDSM